MHVVEYNCKRNGQADLTPPVRFYWRKKFQLEIAKTTEAQKKSEQKYKEKIKGLRDELKKEEERLKRENDSLIGDIVRDLLGEVDADNIESFREKIQLLTGLEDSENERPQDNLQGDTGGVHSY